MTKILSSELEDFYTRLNKIRTKFSLSQITPTTDSALIKAEHWNTLLSNLSSTVTDAQLKYKTTPSQVDTTQLIKKDVFDVMDSNLTYMDGLCVKYTQGACSTCDTNSNCSDNSTNTTTSNSNTCSTNSNFSDDKTKGSCTTYWNNNSNRSNDIASGGFYTRSSNFTTKTTNFTFGNSTNFNFSRDSTNDNSSNSTSCSTYSNFSRNSTNKTNSTNKNRVD